MKKIMVAMMLMLGASNAYAVGQCSTVCQGPDEPCKMRCAIGTFVTTCDQIAGNVCVRFPAAGEPDDMDHAGLAPSCEAEVELLPIVAEWIRAAAATFA